MDKERILGILTAHEPELNPERHILTLSELASRLEDQAQVLVSDADWRSVRGIGNRLRQGYDFINDEVIWRTIHLDLRPLRDAVAAALLRFLSEGSPKQ